jgi:hypothetical protein
VSKAKEARRPAGLLVAVSCLRYSLGGRRLRSTWRFVVTMKPRNGQHPPPLPVNGDRVRCYGYASNSGTGSRGDTGLEHHCDCVRGWSAWHDDYAAMARSDDAQRLESSWDGLT